MTNFPKPGKPVRGSRSGVPVMALFDLLGRRWAMGIIWTLCTHEPCTFRTLQAQCGSISPAVLNVRLKELRQAGLVELSSDGYSASRAGHELYKMLKPIGTWSKRWAGRFALQQDAKP